MARMPNDARPGEQATACRRFFDAMKGGIPVNGQTVSEAEGVPREKQEDGIFALDGKGNPIRLEVPDDADD